MNPQSAKDVPSESKDDTAVLPISTLLLGVAIFMIGSGLQSTLLGVRAVVEGMSSFTIGAIMTGYFIGYALASMFAPGFIRSVGHIRTFAAFASLFSAAALAYILNTSSELWLFLRTLQGICHGAMILVVESWLNSACSSSSRGRVLSIYQVVLLGGLMLGQLLLNIAEVDGAVLFCLSSILLSLCLVPMTLARVEQPHMPDPKPLGIVRLYHISPIALVATLIGSVALNAFVSLMPTYGAFMQYDTFSISIFIVAFLLGGFLLQWPLGWLSDRIDRRIIIIVCALLSSVLLGVKALVFNWNEHGLIALCFVYGSITLCTYPICAAYLNDFVNDEERLGAASSLIFAYGAGAVFGPFICGLVMESLGPEGLFYMLFALHIALVAFALYRYTKRKPISEEEKEEFIAVPRTTFAALALDERFDEPAAGQSAEY